jgi:8-oxo-dGTP pyrophosphatase MutT (NUDIX family)
MSLKIYFNEKPVYLCDEIDEKIKEITSHPDAVFIDELSTHAINALLHEIKKDDFHAGVIYNENLEQLKKAFFRHFTVIEASGGIVQNEKKEILFIFRRNKWDLPKGKLEDNESLLECAIREIEEETGVTDLVFRSKIGETYHTYKEYGKTFMKISHWFSFSCDKPQKLKPQTEEDITETVWVKETEINNPLGNTYQNIADIIEKFYANT